MKFDVVQSNFLSGVLDSRASARVEADAYNEGLLVGNNIELHHLGGIRRRRGLRFRYALPNVLTRISSGITATAPNGGTASNATDDSTTTVVTTTTPVGTTNEFVVVHYDLGSAKAVAFADVLGIRTVSGSSTQFRVQYSSDNVSWDNLVPSGSSELNLDVIDTAPRDYRRVAGVSRRYWRVVRIGTTNLPSNITLADFNLWQDSGTISNVRLLPFEVSDTQRFVVAVTDRSATVFQNGEWYDSIPLPYVSADIQEIDADASESELIVVHEDYPPRVLFEDSTGNMQSEPTVFSALPKVDYADSLSPVPTSEIQVITFGGTLAAGVNTFQVALEGARSASISYAGDSSAAQQLATADNLAREIQKLYTVPGEYGVSCARTNTNEYTVTFAEGSAKAFKLMSVTPVTGEGTATVARTQAGTTRSEDAWSATRGYPRTIAFFEKRIYFGGTRSKPQSLFGSRVNDTLNFELSDGLDDDAIFVTLSGQQTNIIRGLLAGRTLQIFTSGGEFRYVVQPGDPIRPRDVPKNQTQHGSKKIRPVAVDGATVFVHRTGKALRDFKYEYQEDAYGSLPLSSLAPGLLNDITDLAAWNGSQVDELNYVFVVNSDGTVAVLNLRKESDVRALVSWTTAGLFKAVTCVLEDIFFAVLRDINDTAILMLESLEYDYYTDCAAKVVNDPASASVVGLSHLNGQECVVRADGFHLSNETPAGGAITLDSVYEDIEVGLGFNPSATPMPLNAMTPSGASFMRKRRVVKIRTRVRNTLGLLINGRVIPDRKFDVNNFDEPAIPYSGVHTLEETSNYDETEDKLVTFSQNSPMPWEILGIDVVMESA